MLEGIKKLAETVKKILEQIYVVFFSDNRYFVTIRARTSVLKLICSEMYINNYY